MSGSAAPQYFFMPPLLVLGRKTALHFHRKILMYVLFAHWTNVCCLTFISSEKSSMAKCIGLRIKFTYTHDFTYMHGCFRTKLSQRLTKVLHDNKNGSMHDNKNEADAINTTQVASDIVHLLKTNGISRGYFASKNLKILTPVFEQLVCEPKSYADMKERERKIFRCMKKWTDPCNVYTI
jgi:hypothetical protein